MSDINRVVFNDNGTSDDISRNVAKYKSGSKSFSYAATEDAFYIGGSLPFNHLYFKLGSIVNALPSTVSIRYFNGVEFVPVVNIDDETEVSGASLAQSGYITWTTDKHEAWKREDTVNNDDVRINELADITIYDRYWLEIKFSADLTPNVELEWLGQLFSDDDDLGAEYPDLARSNVRQAFGGVGKTDWQEQHIRAAELIVKDLVSKKVVRVKEQILDRDAFTLASVSKCAELIYRGLGDDYIDDRIEARNEYQARLNKGNFNVDKDKDARVDPEEKKTSEGWVNR